jgi:2-amino-4-hydroxy-6-hydroxymethyldihydropteridine diphosphokinase
VSDAIETDPVGPVPQGRFLNAAATLHTALEARDLLDQLLAIERQRGRTRAREERWGPRTLDLDLLLYGDRIIEEPGLSIPHPRLHERTFVLAPLSQIAPDVVVPTLGRTIRELALAVA